MAALLGVCLLALLVPSGPRADRPLPAATPAARPAPPSVESRLPARGQHQAVEGSTAPASVLSEVLARRSRALVEDDLVGWLRDLDAADAGLVAAERARFARLRALPLASWTYVRAAGSNWVVRYRLEGDRTDSEVPVAPLVRWDEVRWVLIDTGQVGPALWDLEGLHVARGARSLVLGGGTDETLATLAEQADQAVTIVEDAWDRPWAERLVVVIPTGWAQAVDLLRVPSGGESEQGGTERSYDGFAALTTSLDPPGRPDPQRILLDPVALEALGPAARQVLLTHEAVHVATGPSALPLWLSEGFADEVAYRDLDDDWLRAALPALLRAARAGRLPEALPDDGEFAAGGGIAARAYEGAHLLVRVLVRAAGPDAVADAYDEARLADRDGGDALLTRLGLDAADVLARWRTEITRLADD